MLTTFVAVRTSDLVQDADHKDFCHLGYNAV
jgi:hypothetical protein